LIPATSIGLLREARVSLIRRHAALSTAIGSFCLWSLGSTEEILCKL
jgi:hypothetical protein